MTPKERCMRLAPLVMGATSESDTRQPPCAYRREARYAAPHGNIACCKRIATDLLTTATAWDNARTMAFASRAVARPIAPRNVDSPIMAPTKGGCLATHRRKPLSSCCACDCDQPRCRQRAVSHNMPANAAAVGRGRHINLGPHTVPRNPVPLGSRSAGQQAQGRNPLAVTKETKSNCNKRTPAQAYRSWPNPHAAWSSAVFR